MENGPGGSRLPICRLVSILATGRSVHQALQEQWEAGWRYMTTGWSLELGHLSDCCTLLVPPGVGGKRWIFYTVLALERVAMVGLCILEARARKAHRPNKSTCTESTWEPG